MSALPNGGALLFIEKHLCSKLYENAISMMISVYDQMNAFTTIYPFAISSFNINNNIKGRTDVRPFEFYASYPPMQCPQGV